MRRFTCEIQRTELLTISETVPEWEIPLLQLIHGPERVSVKDFTLDEKNYPAPAAEYERLEKRYREDPATGASYVSQIYGPAPGGARILMQAIKNAALEQDRDESVEGPGFQDPELDEVIAAPAIDPAKVAIKPAKATKVVQKVAKAPVKTIIGKQATKPSPVKVADPLAADPLAIDA